MGISEMVFLSLSPLGICPRQSSRTIKLSVFCLIRYQAHYGQCGSTTFPISWDILHRWKYFSMSVINLGVYKLLKKMDTHYTDDKS